ncbi:MoaD/ThiS family protein [Acidihalobacter prosperus]
MSITVFYFASLRERFGRAEEHIDATGLKTVGDVWVHVASVDASDRRILASLNQQHVTMNQPVADGDEIAFFPPVTGG